MNIFRNLLCAGLLIPVLVAGQTNNVSQSPGYLSAGTAKIDITPDIPVKLYGYASRKTYSEGVHDHLFARAVVFESSGRKAVFITADLGSFGEKVFPYIQEQIIGKYNLKSSELFLSTIHSHSSPVLTLDPETGDTNNIRYTKALTRKLLDLTGMAISRLEPVMVGTGTGSSPVGSNRREVRSDGSIILGRNPYGPTDKEVLVMKVSWTNGNPVAALYDYATHATSLGPRNMMISGDVLGISAQFVEKILGNDMVSPLFAGASGDIDPWYRVLPGFNNEEGWIPEPVLLGTLLGEEVVTVFRNIRDVKAGGEVRTIFTRLECPARKKEGDSGQDQATVPVNITAARVGDIAFIGFNVEMLNQIGKAIKEGSPFKSTFIITHCNGSSGYLPPADLYREGGYEVTSTRFDERSAEMVIREAIRMLGELSDNQDKI